MESGEEFTAAEVLGLLENDVVGAIIRPLVFLSGEFMGFPEMREVPGTEHGKQERAVENGMGGGKDAGTDMAQGESEGA
ncbi:MAG: hypothetical protein K2O97_10945, partial [Acetatifactor sp.]|nr:hypothetical protein [Acetatifactor sp.]